jgi:hypothetical protein
MKQLIRDLPLYANGFVLGRLAFSDPTWEKLFLFAVAGVTFFWYAQNVRKETIEQLSQKTPQQ